MSDNGSLTRRLVQAVLNVTEDNLPRAAIELSKQVCVDGIGVMVAGSQEPLGVGRLVTQWVRDAGGKESSSVVAGGFRVPAMAAAFANGTMGHALDFDNFWHPRNHPMSPTVPAILALAEEYGFSGKRVLTAISIAFEVQVRLRMASEGLELGKGFHKTGTTGVMGSAAACGWLLGLDETQLAMALGIAGSRAGSLAINTGTMTKSSQSGNAARMGVECAELARRGWTASTRVFDKGGFFDTIVGPRHDGELLVEHFADPFYMVEHGLGFKKYPCNGFTQRPIDAALQLRREHDIDPEEIDKVEVDVPPFDYVNRPSPETGLEGKFSIQYTTTVALLDGHVGVTSFSNDRRFAPDVQRLLAKVSLCYDETIPLGALDTLVRLRVFLKDGSVLSCEKQKITGMVGVPLTQEERETKFFSCTSLAMDRSVAEKILADLYDLENLSDVRGVMSLVSMGHD